MKSKKKLYKKLAMATALSVVPGMVGMYPISPLQTVEAANGRMIYVIDSNNDASTAGQGTPEQPYQSLKHALAQAADGDTIVLRANIVYRSQSNAPLLEIDKQVTIDGGSHSLTIRGANLLLKKPVTFKNITLGMLLDGGEQSKIYANGYALTLDNVNTKIGSRQDTDRPMIFGGHPTGTAEGAKAVIKIVNGGSENRYKKIVAGNENGSSATPVDILIENSSAKVDDGVDLGNTSAQVYLHNTSKEVKNINGTNSVENTVELDGISSFAMQLTGVKNLTLKNNANIVLSSSLNVSGTVTVEDGATLGLKASQNMISTLSGGGTIHIGEPINDYDEPVQVEITQVVGTEKPKFEFQESQEDLKKRKDSRPVIQTDEANFAKLSGDFEYRRKQDTPEKNPEIEATTQLYREAKAIKEQYDTKKTEAQEAINETEKTAINTLADQYSQKYQAAQAKLATLPQKDQEQVDKQGLTEATLPSVTVNDSDNNNKVDEIEKRDVKMQFDALRQEVETYNQLKPAEGSSINQDKANELNAKAQQFNTKLSAAKQALETLSRSLREELQPEIDQMGLPEKIELVVPNDLNNNGQTDETEIQAVNDLYIAAKQAMDAYTTEKQQAQNAFSEAETTKINAKANEYKEKYDLAKAEFDKLDSRLQVKVVTHNLPEELSMVVTNDTNENDKDDSVDAVDALYQAAKLAKEAYGTEVATAGKFITVEEATKINKKVEEYHSALKKAKAAFDKLEEKLQAQVTLPNPELPSTLDVVKANDMDGNDQLDTEQIQEVQKLFDVAKESLGTYKKVKLDAGKAFGKADVDAIFKAKDNYENNLAEAMEKLSQLAESLKSHIDQYDLQPITEDVPQMNDKDNNEVADVEQVAEVEKAVKEATEAFASFDGMKAQVGPAISMEEHRMLTAQKATYDQKATLAKKKYDELMAALNPVHFPPFEMLQLDVPAVNDKDNNNEVDAEQIQPIQAAFDKAKQAKEAYDQAVLENNEEMNTLKTVFEDDLKKAKTLFYTLPKVLQTEVNTYGLKVKEDSVFPWTNHHFYPELLENLSQNNVAKMSGWVKENGIWSFYVENQKATGWLKDLDKWYYLDENGTMLTGWIKDDGKWYYLNRSGAMATGWVYDDGSWYYLTHSGAMATGWIFDEGLWYYLKGNGQMVFSRWVKSNGIWYYLKENGQMAVSEVTPDGYTVDSSGKWVQ